MIIRVLVGIILMTIAILLLNMLGAWLAVAKLRKAQEETKH